MVWLKQHKRWDVTVNKLFGMCYFLKRYPVLWQVLLWPYSSAIAGGIAYRDGYQRLDMQIMFAVIVVLVMLVQMTGDRISQHLDKRKL